VFICTGGTLSADDPGLQAQGAELDGGAEEEAEADSSAEEAEGEPSIADYEGADSGSYMQEAEYAAAEPKPTQTHTKPLTVPRGMHACFRLCLIVCCCCKGALAKECRQLCNPG